MSGIRQPLPTLAGSPLPLMKDGPAPVTPLEFANRVQPTGPPSHGASYALPLESASGPVSPKAVPSPLFPPRYQMNGWSFVISSTMVPKTRSLGALYATAEPSWFTAVTFIRSTLARSSEVNRSCDAV
jgi:hypothetical protein